MKQVLVQSQLAMYLESSKVNKSYSASTLKYLTTIFFTYNLRIPY